jgi:RNA-directed DNA polymerase
MQRPKNQMMLNLGTGVLGEAQNAAAQETEIGAAKACLERPAVTGPSMESIVERNNMERALEQVRRNKGAPGGRHDRRRAGPSPEEALARDSGSTT